MASKAGRSLFLALSIVAAVRALQADNPGAAGLAAQYNRYRGQAYDPQYRQGFDQAQHRPHQYQQQEQRHSGEQQGQRPFHHYQQQQQRGPTTGASSSSQAATAVEGTVEATAVRDDPPPLPYGWGELRTGDGRPYYVYYPEGTVQWERPAPPKDPENDQQRAPQSAERGQQPSPAEATGRDDNGAGVAGESDRELEIGGSNGDAAQGCVEEDTSIPVGESEMSDAEGAEGDVDDDGNDLGVLADSARAIPAYPGEHAPTRTEQHEGQASGLHQYPPRTHVEPNASRGPSIPDVATVVDPFQRHQRPDERSEGGGDDDKGVGGPGSSPPDPWSDQIRASPAAGARDENRHSFPSSLSAQRIQLPAAGEEPSQPWMGPTSPTPVELPVNSGEAKRPPIWGTEGNGRANPTYPQQQQQQPRTPGNEAVAPHRPWGQSSPLGGSNAAHSPPPAASAHATNAPDQGDWRPSRDLRERGRVGTMAPGQAPGSGGVSDPWQEGWRRGPDLMKRPMVGAYGEGDGVGQDEARAAAEGIHGEPSRAQSQYATPFPSRQQPQQERRHSGGSYEETASPPQGSSFRPKEANSWVGGSGNGDGSGGGGEPRDGPNFSGWRHQQPPPGQGPSQWRAGPHQSAPPTGNPPVTGDGSSWWSSSAQGRIPGRDETGGDRGAPDTWGGREEWQGVQGRGHQEIDRGFVDRDGGHYDYQGQGGPGGGAPASRRNEDEYAGYPAGSRALVPHSAYSYSSGMLEVREQGLHLVRGAWSRILVRTGKTRAVLRDYGGWAGSAASNAGVKIKSTVGSVTSRVAYALERDPQGMSGPYGQPPRSEDYYGGGPGSPRPDRTGQYYPRTWGPAGSPSGFGNAPQAGENIQGGYGGDRGHRRNEAEAGSAAGGGYASGRQDSRPGGAERRGPGGYAGDAAGGYPEHQRGVSPPESTFSYGTGGEGGREPRGVGKSQGVGGESGVGAGMPTYGSQQQHPPQQPRQQPPQQPPQQQEQRWHEGQGPAVQSQKDSAFDGGYWSPC